MPLQLFMPLARGFWWECLHAHEHWWPCSFILVTEFRCAYFLPFHSWKFMQYLSGLVWLGIYGSWIILISYYLWTFIKQFSSLEKKMKKYIRLVRLNEACNLWHKLIIIGACPRRISFSILSENNLNIGIIWLIFESEITREMKENWHCAANRTASVQCLLLYLTRCLSSRALMVGYERAQVKNSKEKVFLN